MLRTALLATTAAAALAAPGSALAAGWAEPQTVATYDWSSGFDAALGGEGSIGLAWTTENAATIVDRSPGGAFGTTPVSPAWGIALDADEAGTITAAWANGAEVDVRTRPAGGAFGPVQKIGGAGAHAFLDVSPNGTTLVAWRGNEGLKARIRPAGSATFGPEQQIVPQGTNVGDVDVAVADSGEAIVIWENGQMHASYKVRPPGGAFPEQSSSFGTTERVSSVDLEMNARGDAQIAFEATNTATGAQAIGAAHRAAGGSWTVDAAVGDATASHSVEPDAAIAPDGAGLVAWQADDAVQVVERPGDAYGEPGDVPATAPIGAFAALDARGAAVVAWHEEEESDDAYTRVTVARRPRGAAGFGAPVTLSAPERWVDETVLRTNRAGDVLVGWTTEGDEDTIAQYALWQADRPGPGEPARPQSPQGDGSSSTTVPPAVAPAPHRPRAGAPAAAPLRALKVRRAGAWARVSFRLAVPATVTVALERRAGRRWKATGRKVTVRGKAGANAARLGLRGLKPGRYRVSVTVAGAPGRRHASLTLPRRR